MSDERRNVHCSNCGDTRGGPIGHEAHECTRDVSRETLPALDVPPTGRTLHNVLKQRREIT
jgi:hypothetical protein